MLINGPCKAVTHKSEVHEARGHGNLLGAKTMSEVTCFSSFFLVKKWSPWNSNFSLWSFLFRCLLFHSHLLLRYFVWLVSCAYLINVFRWFLEGTFNCRRVCKWFKTLWSPSYIHICFCAFLTLIGIIEAVVGCSNLWLAFLCGTWRFTWSSAIKWLFMCATLVRVGQTRKLLSGFFSSGYSTMTTRSAAWPWNFKLSKAFLLWDWLHNLFFITKSWSTMPVSACTWNYVLVLFLLLSYCSTISVLWTGR